MIPGVTKDELKIGPGAMKSIETFEAGKRVEISVISDDGSGTVHGTILSGDKNQIKVVADSDLLMVNNPMAFRDSNKEAPKNMAANLEKWSIAINTEIKTGITMNMAGFEDYQK